MKKPPRISEAEWAVMNYLWKHSPSSAQEVIENVGPRENWEPATVKTLLNRLVHKGALTFRKQGKAYLYSPAFPEELCRRAEAQTFLDRVFDGALSPMIAHLVRSHPLSEKDFQELSKLLQEKRKEKS